MLRRVALSLNKRVRLPIWNPEVIFNVIYFPVHRSKPKEVLWLFCLEFVTVAVFFHWFSL